MTPLYLDLDGPLLDVSERYHLVHAEIVRDLGRAPRLSRQEYWEAKRAGEGASAIAAREGLDEHAEAYLARWIERIEADGALEHDALQPGALPTLAEIAERRPVVLVTLRQNRAGLERQLDRLAIRPHLAALLSASPLSGRGEEVKERLVREHGLPIEDAWLAGDTEIDVRAARRLGMRAAALTCGIRSEALLRRERPDLIIPTLADLP